MIAKRLLTLELVVAAGLGSVFLLPNSGRSSPAGIALTLPNYFAGWIGRDEAVTQRELDVLAKDTQFARKLYTDPPGNVIFVSIVMSGEDMASSIHRPERCLDAQGWSLRKSDKRTVTLSNGKILELTRLCNEQLYGGLNEKPMPIESVTYYWFVGYDAMTASHFMRTMIDVKDRILYGHNQRWAYVTATAVFGGDGRDPQAATHQVSGVMEKFIQQMAQELKRPDGRALF